MNNIAVVIVSFCGGNNILKTVKALLSQIKNIIIIDNNSDSNTKNVLSKIENLYKVKIIYNKDNMGLAYALNQGISNAKDLGFEWVLTMDQDSIADQQMLKELKEGIKKFSWNEKVVSFSPRIVYAPILRSIEDVVKIQNINIYEEKLVVITSGNLIKINALNDIGYFKEDLFIDSLDFDICLRLKISGYKIIKCNKAILYHSLGERKELNVSGIKIYFVTHTPYRKYYMIRNHIYIIKKYLFRFPLFCIIKQIYMFGIILRTLLFENKRYESARYIMHGIFDGIMSNYGQYRFNR